MMGRLLAIALLILWAATPIGADEAAAKSKSDSRKGASSGDAKSASAGAKDSAAGKGEEDSPLVQAARRGRLAREKGDKSRVVITDETVKQSTGRVTVFEGQPGEIRHQAEPADQVFTRMAAEKKAKEQAAADAKAKIERLEEEIARLDRDLRRTQDEYFDEGDLNYREEVLQDRWKDARDRLAEKREELERVRRDYQRLSRETSNVYKP
ncbi:MAG TPA: hypothetical protein VMS56_03690 [Thermoanaerobaculia bacterium]|nr:hypothetical protein [Thermoanaerobaculia bacterium]